MTAIRAIAVIQISILAWTSYGQDFHFSGFMQNVVYVNPAYAALPSSAEIGLTYRNQWPGIPATFVTYGAALIVPVSSLSSGIGVSVTNDIQGSGVISQSAVSLLYAYLFRTGSNWYISAGLSASYNFKRFSADQLVFRSEILNELGYSYAPVLLENYSRSYPDFSVGLIAVNNDNLTMGISVAHVTRPQHAFREIAGSRLPIKYTIFASRAFPVGGGKIISAPAVFYSLQQDNQELIYGSKFIFSNNIMLGGWIRQNLKFNLDALIISAGISWAKYNISYHYDVNLKKISFLSTKMAAHEVTFLYRFEYKDEQKGRKIKKIDCPAYN